MAYKFKTEEEFIKEYGPDWRGRVPQTWNSSMDKYLGEVITKPSEIESVRRGELFHRGNWTFSPQMIIKEVKKGELEVIPNGFFNSKT